MRAHWEQLGGRAGATPHPCRVVLLLALCGPVATEAIASSQARASAARQQQTMALKALSLEELGNVQVITLSKQPETVWQIPAAIAVITPDDIRRSGATTLPEMLRLVPGVIVGRSDANRWAVGIRGFADIFSKSVLVLIDGRSAYTPLVGGVHWAVQDVLLGDIERIEVIRGPGGSIWGANAVNGVINVITRSADQTHGTRVTAATGTVEHGRASVRYGGSNGSHLHYRVYGKAFTHGPQFHADEANFDAWRAGQAGTRIDWQVRPRDRITVSADAYRTRTGERAEISDFAPPALRTVDGTLDLTGGNGLLRWEHESSGGSTTRLQAYYDRTNRQGFTFGEVRTTLDVDLNTRLTRGERHQFAWGAGWRMSPSTVRPQVATLNFLPNEHTFTLISGFAQDDISLVPGVLSLVVGTRVEHNTYTGVEVLPSARVLWRLRPQEAVWASVTRTVRTPSRFERDLRFQVLLDPSTPLFLNIEGTSGFRAETLVGAEVGYRALLAGAVFIDVTAFHNNYRDLAALGNSVVSSETMPSPHLRVTVPFVNGIRGSTRGFEIAPEWRPSAWWQLKGSYTHLQLSLQNTPELMSPVFRDNYVGSAPHHQVRLQSRLDLPRRLQFDQTYRFVGALPAQTVRAYHTVDARLGWRISDRVEVSVIGQNLVQPHHAEFHAVPVEIRRSAYAQLVLTR